MDNPKALILSCTIENIYKNDDDNNDTYDVDNGKLPDNYLIIKITNYKWIKGQKNTIAQKIEDQGTYKNIKVNLTCHLYFINKDAKQDEIYVSYLKYNKIDKVCFNNCNNFIYQKHTNLVYPCIIECEYHDITKNIEITKNYSFKRLTNINSYHKIFIMDHKYSLTKAAKHK